jgi:DeoR/GlpR family transcriptional regulator of sugar metabolism
MLAEKRRQELYREIHLTGQASVSDLARRFHVSTETIRRDLEALERQGLVQRTHGGAVALRWTAEQTFAERSRLHEAEKRLIAQEAFTRFASVQSLVLDAGSTTMALAQLLRARRDLWVVTNSLPAALTLSDAPGIRVTLLGGDVYASSAALVGAWAGETLERVRVEVAFMAASAADEEGLYVPTSMEAAVKSLMLRVARRAVLLMDSSKFHQPTAGMLRFARWPSIHALVTDAGAVPQTVEKLRREGTFVVTVPAPAAPSPHSSTA